MHDFGCGLKVLDELKTDELELAETEREGAPCSSLHNFHLKHLEH